MGPKHPENILFNFNNKITDCSAQRCSVLLFKPKHGLGHPELFFFII